MQLEWFTTVAQIVNFLILVVLLKRFLYGPIIRAMDAREAHIATRVQAAQDQLLEAERQAAHYHEQLQAMNEAREAILNRAEEEAETQRQRLLDQARQDVQQLQARWRQTLQQEQTSWLQELRRQAGLQVVTVARHAVEDLAHADLEKIVMQVFLDRLKALDEEARQAFRAAGGDRPMAVMIRSAFPVPVDVQQTLRQAVREHLAEHAEVQFATVPALLCGIELEAKGRKLAWHMASYMDRLEEQFAAMLQQNMETKAAMAWSG
jgi:F-type H+-transporting ATPase subunit b